MRQVAESHGFTHAWGRDLSPQRCLQDTPWVVPIHVPFRATGGVISHTVLKPWVGLGEGAKPGLYTSRVCVATQPCLEPSTGGHPFVSSASTDSA